MTVTGPCWNDQLLSQERAYTLAGDWPLRPGVRGGQMFLDCLDCGQAVMRLAGNLAVPGYVISPDGVVSAVVRHMVMAHDVPLSGLGRVNGRGTVPRRGEADQDAGRGRVGRRGGGPGDADPGSADQEAGDRRGSEAEEGGGG